MEEFEKALKSATRLLRFRPRSIRELSIRLRKRFDEQTCRAVIQELCDKKFLDDYAFAKFWIENRIHFKPMARSLLYRELSVKGVDGQLIRQVLEEALPENEHTMAETLLASRRKRIRPEDPKRYDKLYGFLRRRGFAHELVTELLERDASSHDDRQ